MSAQELAITSDEALVLDQVVGRTIVIVGGGRVALEFASIFQGCGASVHLVYLSQLPLPR